MVAIDCPAADAEVAPADVRAALADAGYTAEALAAACGCPDLLALIETDDAELAERCTSAALVPLVRLLLLGGTLERGAARRALGHAALDACTRIGLLADADGWVVARARLLPVEGVLLASDFPRGAPGGIRPDYVMGADASSLALAALTIRRARRRTLDVGTGCGAQALLAGRHSATVVATDRNPRATAFGAFNAWLNEIANVHVIRGDFGAPIRPDAFDLVLCNPPFVIAPMRRRPFADGDGRADDLCRDLVRALPAHLVEGGVAQIMLHWAHVAGEDPTARVSSWSPSGCDALLVRTETVDADAYVARWSDAAGAGAWRRYLARARIEAVSAGVLTLRRRLGASWFRRVDAPARPVRPAGEDVRRMIVGIDLAVASDEALLAAKLGLPPEVGLEQQLAPGGAGWRLVGARLRLDQVLAFTADVEPGMAELLGRCDGRRSLRAVVEEVATTRRTDRVPSASSVLPSVRSLLERGFLLVQ